MSNLNQILSNVNSSDILKAQLSVDEMMKINPALAAPRYLRMIAYDNEMVCNPKANQQSNGNDARPIS